MSSKKAKKHSIEPEVLTRAMDFAIKVSEILQKDNRYDVEAYNFVLSALDYTLSRLKEKRHVSGVELLEGIREYGMKLYGPMTKTVFEHWGVKTTEDFGEIVFNMIEVGLLYKRPEDTKEEFKSVYDFKVAFEDPYCRSLRPRIKSFFKKQRKNSQHLN